MLKNAFANKKKLSNISKKLLTDNYIYLPIGYLHLTTVKDLDEQNI